MNQRYKQTDIGLIPIDWKVATLREVSNRVKTKNDGSEHEILTISAKTGFVRQADRYSRYMAGKSVENYTLLKQGQFSYNKGNSLTYPFGCIYRLDGYSQALVPNVYISFALSEEADSEFCKHLFLEGDFIGRLKKYITSGVRGNGLLNVNPDDFFSLQLALPPLPEQQKIAEILSTVDEKMAVIDEQLAQTQELKNGLMQRLLTRGIGHTAFKDSPLGEVPESWEVELLGAVFKRIVVGYVGSITSNYCEENEGVPFIRTLNVRDGYFEAKGFQYVSNTFHQQNKKSWVVNDDILIARVGANMGMTCKVTGLTREANAANVIIIKQSKAANSDFYALFLASEYGQSQIRANGVGGAQAVLNTGSAQRLLVPVPSLSEQLQIAEILTTIDEKLQVLTDKKAQYQELKRGLMQQLLTGQRRVRVATELATVA